MLVEPFSQVSLKILRWIAKMNVAKNIFSHFSPKWGAKYCWQEFLLAKRAELMQLDAWSWWHLDYSHLITLATDNTNNSNNQTNITVYLYLYPRE